LPKGGIRGQQLWATKLEGALAGGIISYEHGGKHLLAATYGM
jgi:hypothetical protein